MNFADWINANAKHLDPTDLVRWCQAAYYAGAEHERERIIKLATTEGGDACDFGEWLRDQARGQG